jgi:putative hydrolase of the HAD superfamily
VGNVLFAYDPDKIIDQIVGESPFKSQFLQHLFHSPDWQLMDRGDLTVEALLQKLENNPHFDDAALPHIPHLVARFPDYLDPISDMILLFQQVSAQRATYVLSNFQDAPFDRLHQNNPFFNQARGIVVSAKVNMMKPELEIYHHLVGHYNLDPAETVFIDDLPANIEAAESLGIRGILYGSPDQVRAELCELGIKV